jgi:hypothetical protein
MLEYVAGAEELDQDGCGLNVRDAVMEKIFVVDTATQDANKVCISFLLVTGTCNSIIILRIRFRILLLLKLTVDKNYQRRHL